jgi:hypothetical protein
MLDWFGIPYTLVQQREDPLRTRKNPSYFARCCASGHCLTDWFRPVVD